MVDIKRVITLIFLIMFSVFLHIPKSAIAEDIGTMTISEKKQLEKYFSVAAKKKGETYMKARETIIKMGKKVLPYLMEKAKDENWETKMTAEICIGWLTKKGTFTQCSTIIEEWTKLPVGIDRLGRPRIMIWKGGKGLGSFGPSAIPVILEFLIKLQDDFPKYQRPELKDALLGNLRYIVDRYIAEKNAIKSATIPLIQFFHKEKDEYLRADVLWILAKMKDKRALMPLVEILRNDENYKLRRVTAWTLGHIGDDSILKPLEEIAKTDKSKTVRQAIKKAIKNIQLRIDKEKEKEKKETKDRNKGEHGKEE